MVPPRFKIPVVPCIKLPVPVNAVVAVTVELLVTETPVTVSDVAAVNILFMV